MSLLATDRDGLTIEEFARRTSLSVSTIRRRIKDGQLPFWQPGGPGTRLLLPANSLPFQPAATLPATRPVESANPSTNRASSRLSGPLPRWKRHR